MTVGILNLKLELVSRVFFSDLDFRIIVQEDHQNSRSRYLGFLVGVLGAELK